MRPLAGVLVHTRKPVAAATSSLPPVRAVSAVPAPPLLLITPSRSRRGGRPYAMGQFDRAPVHARTRHRDSPDDLFGAAAASSAPLTPRSSVVAATLCSVHVHGRPHRH